jgi:hypothetical protein
MKGRTANAEMLHRLDQSGDTDPTGDLCNNSGALRHFQNDIRRESCLPATANQLIIEHRIRFTRRQYPALVS